MIEKSNAYDDMIDRTVGFIRHAIKRCLFNRAALAEWLGTGLPSREQEFDSPGSLPRFVGRRQHLSDHVLIQMGTYLGRVGRGLIVVGAKQSFSDTKDHHSDVARHVPLKATTYIGLTP